jgi:hypothetical protein
MEWLVAVMRWNEGRVDLLIQTDDERLFTLTTETMNPKVIGLAIARQLGIDESRVIYDSTRQTLYRRLTYMRYAVLV